MSGRMEEAGEVTHSDSQDGALHQASSAIHKVWATASLRSNIFTFIPTSSYPNILTLSQEVYELAIRHLYGHTTMIDYMAVRQVVVSYSRLLSIQNAVRSISLIGCFPMVIPFFGFTHICDTFPRLTRIAALKYELSRLIDSEGSNGDHKGWIATLHLGVPLSGIAHIPSYYTDWVIPDDWDLVYDYNLTITPDVPDIARRREAGDVNETPEWLLELRKADGVEWDCLPQCLTELHADIESLSIAGRFSGEEMVKMFVAAESEGLGLGMRALNLFCKKGDGLRFIPSLGNEVGECLETLCVSVPNLTFDKALQRSLWTSFTSLQDLTIFIHLYPDDSDTLKDLELNGDIPVLHLRHFRLLISRNGIDLAMCATRLDSMLPSTLDLARAMFAIGGPNCQYSIQFAFLFEMRWHKRDLAEYIRQARTTGRVEIALHSVQAFHYMTMYENLVKRDIRRLNGAETVDKGWFKMEKKVLAGIDGESTDVGVDDWGMSRREDAGDYIPIKLFQAKDHA